MTPVDKLEIMLNTQAALQERLNVVYDQAYREKMSLALIDEVMESLRETPWKPWKKNQHVNYQAMCDELIDALHFLLNLFLAAGMTADDIFNRYMKKQAVNHERQDTGY